MSEPYYEHEGVTLHHGDCIEVMRAMPDSSVHAIVTDPPYGLGFMGKGWDDLPPGLPWAVECLRVLKPGGYLLAFGGSRTWHRLAVAVEDAGFEIRDSIAWLYGSGFPKSLDVSKAIDKAAGAERETGPIDPARAGRLVNQAGAYSTETGWSAGNRRVTIDPPATPAAELWQGWGTALKPAFEPIVMGRKPLTGTVAANVLAHGTGAINVDGCRVEHSDPTGRVSTRLSNGKAVYGDYANQSVGAVVNAQASESGRWPTNVILDGSQAEELDRQSGTLTSGANPTSRGADGSRSVLGAFGGQDDANPQRGADSGGASRFFPTFHYEAKAPGNERPNVEGVQHPTVKPLDLMRWLVRLVTPSGGTVLEPFAGSGTTLEACLIEGFEVIGIERAAEYLPLIMQRIKKPLQQSLFGDAA